LFQFQRQRQRVRDRRTRHDERAAAHLIVILAWLTVSAGWHRPIRSSVLLMLTWLLATAAIHVSLWRTLSDAPQPNDVPLTATQLTAASLAMSLLAMLLP